MGRQVFQKRISVLAIFSFLAITLITLFKSALELEDAEQAYYSQWLRWGYDDQPPIYTWLQYGFNTIFGVGKISFSILRGLLFAGTLTLLFRFSRHRIDDKNNSKLAVLALVLVPVYIDFTFRRLSHTSLLCFFVIASYYCIQLLAQRKSIFNYVLFGLIIGVGLLSKYNYVFFLLSFCLVSIWDRELRTIVLNPKALLSLAVTILLVTPHAYWLLGPGGFQYFLETSVQEKIGVEEVRDQFSIMPLFIYTKGLVTLFFPILVVLVIGYFLKFVEINKQKHSWLSKMFLAQLLVLGLFFLIFQSQKVETRWLLPLFIPFTVLLFKNVSIKSSRKLVLVGFWIFLGVVFLQTARTPIEKLMKISSSVHFGFEPVANKLKTDYDDYQWVLPNVTYAGNLRLLHPERIIFSKDDYSLSPSSLNSGKVVSVSIFTAEEKHRTPVDSLKGFGKEKENLYFYLD